jgi:hypothetical protein
MARVSGRWPGQLCRSALSTMLALTKTLLITVLSVAPIFLPRDGRIFAAVFRYEDPPVVSLSCTPEPVIAGHDLVCTATIAGKPRYKWHVSAGRIIAGQKTPKVTVDTAALAGRKIRITIDADTRRGLIVSSTREVIVIAEPYH